jgi:hypothetical protein
MNADDLRLNRIRVQFINKPIENIHDTVDGELQKFRDRIFPGMRIAVAVGSRGINNLSVIVRAVIDSLKMLGASPFIIPAMGSHGGATADGQRGVLSEYGITEETMGVPICSAMEVVSLGKLRQYPTIDLLMDRYAYEADAVFVVNRVKAHTDFHSTFESGLVKMLVIGLGKAAQAQAIHSHLLVGLREIIPVVAKELISAGKILGGLAIVEDGYENTSILKGVLSENILEEDACLLKESKLMMPRLPFSDCHVLVIDWFGKNISGTGMDTNIIGRIGIRGEQEGLPDIKRICLLDMTGHGHGNAVGIGLADVITKRVLDKVDWNITYKNIITSCFLERGFMPIVQPTDKAAIKTAIASLGYLPEGTLKLARIKDTLHIDTIYVTDALLEDLNGKENIEVLKRGILLQFDKNNDLQRL